MKSVMILITFAISASVALASEINPLEEACEAPKKEYSPFVDDHFPTRPLSKTGQMGSGVVTKDYTLARCGPR